MTASMQAALLELEAAYNLVLEQAACFALDASAATTARQTYAALGFVTLRDVVRVDAMTSFAQKLSSFVQPFAEQVTMRHHTRADHTLSDGARFSRVDPHVRHDPEIREKLETLLTHLGFVAFGAMLADKLTDVIQSVVGPLRYHRAYFYIYEEGDYITAHDDRHVGDRVDVQFPVTFHGSGGIRVLENGFLEMHYDEAGSMNVLGPSIWHEIPPLIRGDKMEKPLRVNFGMRFRPPESR